MSVTRSLILISCLACLAAPAHAQKVGSIDLAAGGSVLSTTLSGWSAHVAAQAGRRLALVGEVDRINGTDCGGCAPTYRDTALLGGVRLSYRTERRVSPFWQVLGGELRSRASGYEYFISTSKGTEQRYQQPYTVDYQVVQPGGGATVMIKPRLGVRAQYDFQIAAAGEGLSIFSRFTTSAVVRLGRR